MKIRIVDNSNHETRLTVGKIYEAEISQLKGQQLDYVVINDKGNYMHIWAKRAVII